MGYVGLDELSKVIEGLNGAKATYYAQTSDDPAGRGYNTNASQNRHDHFHVKWHPVEGTHVVDRFHVKNETSARAIYFGISRSKDLIYLTAGPYGQRCGPEQFKNADKYLLEDCEEIADIFLNAICRSAKIKIYDDIHDAIDAYKERCKNQTDTKAQSDKKNDLAVKYGLNWKKLSAKDQAANPQVGPVEVRQKSLAEVTELLDKVMALLNPNQPPVQPPPAHFGPAVPHGSVAMPGATAHLAPMPASSDAPRP